MNCYYYQKNRCVHKRASLVNAGDCPYVSIYHDDTHKCSVKRKIVGFKELEEAE